MYKFQSLKKLYLIMNIFIYYAKVNFILQYVYK